MRLYIEHNDITYGIQSDIWSAIDKSIENNSKETFYVLNSFVRKMLQLSLKKNSIKHFEQYILFYPYFYSTSYEKKSHDNSLEQLHKICSKQAALHLKEVIWLDIGFTARNAKGIEDQKVINEYYYWGFHGFSRLLYFMIRNKDIQQFKRALGEYEQISDVVYGNNYDLKSEIIALQRENPEGKNNEKIKDLKEKYSIINQFATYRRHVLLGIRYWILFLYQIGRLDENTTIEFIKLIKVPHFDPEEVLNDILFFRSGSFHQYMHWGGWDYTERRSGKAYSPPNPHDWLTFGFMVDQIYKNRLFINLEDYNPDELSQVRFLHDDLKGYANYFKDNLQKWKGILEVESADDLEHRLERILSRFAMLKRKSIGNREEAIAYTALSEDKIQEFRQLIGNAWKSQARINRLFKKLGNTEHIIDDSTKLKHIGQRTFFEKAKMMFIDGEHYQMIYGIDRMGGNIGRWEDNEFFSIVIKSEHNKVSGTSVLQVLNKAIAELKSKDILPDLILIAPEYGMDKELLESKLFISKLHQPIENNEEDNEIAFFHLGLFDNVPVYSSYSEFLKNRALVCDFKSAFKMRYKTSPNWYENELTVDIKEVTDEDAKRKMEENPGKWKRTEDGIELSDEDTLTLIKTSVIIDQWSTLDFQIVDKEAFVMAHIKKENIIQ